MLEDVLQKSQGQHGDDVCVHWVEMITSLIISECLVSPHSSGWR